MRGAIVASLVVAAAACNGGAKFEPFHSVTGRFRAEFPGVPDERVVHNLVDSHTFLVDRHGLGSMQVSYYDLLPVAVSPELLFEGMKTDCNAGFKDGAFHPTGDRTVMLGSDKGYDVTGIAPVSADLPDGGFVDDRCFTTHGRAYHVIAIGPNTDDSRAELAHFIDSFAIDP